MRVLKKKERNNNMKNIFATLLTAFGLCVSCHADDSIVVLSPDEYECAVKKDTTAVILDVRTHSEFSDEHIYDAINLDVLDKDLFAAGVDKLDKTKTYYIYCRSGRRSHNAALMMKDRGFKVFDMKGGILEWKAAGKPVCKPDLSQNK